MSLTLPRFYAHITRIHDAQAIDKAVNEAGGEEAPTTVTRATLAGDTRRLRGIPCIAMGVGGTSPGTSPLAALMAKERRA